MKTLAYALIVLGAGCVTDDTEEGPVITQGGTPTSSTPGTSSSTVSGRLCVIENLQDMSTCSTSAGGGLTVTVGNSATTSQPDGTFSMTTPVGLTNANYPAFSVTGAGMVPTSVPFTLPFNGTGMVPVLDADRYARTLTSNGVPLNNQTGAILATVRDNAGPLSGVTVRSTPTAPFGPFFDASGTSQNWGVDGTGMRGVVLIPGLTAGMVDLSFNRILGGQETQVGGVTVRNGGVTILDTRLIGSPTP